MPAGSIVLYLKAIAFLCLNDELTSMGTYCSETHRTHPALNAQLQSTEFLHSAFAQQNIRVLAMRDDTRAMLCTGCCLWLLNQDYTIFTRRVVQLIG